MNGKSIAIVISSLNGGGAEKVCLTLASTLKTLGAKPLLIILSNSADYHINEEIPHTYLSEKKVRLHGKKKQHELADALRNLAIKKNGFSLVLSNLDDCHPIVSCAALPNTYYIIHNSIESEIQRARKMGPFKYWRKIKQYKTLNSKDLITVSKGLEIEINNSHRISPYSTQTIYNPVDRDTIERLANESNPEIPPQPYVLHIGRYAKQKRHDIIFDIADNFDADYIFILLSNRPNKLQQEIVRRKLTHKIKAFGFQQNPYTWIKRAKAVVLSSDFEGFGMVLVEALACNTPTVSTDCPHGPNEILTGKLSQYLTPVGNKVAISDALNKAIKNLSDFDCAPILEKTSAREIAQQYLDLAQQDK